MKIYFINLDRSKRRQEMMYRLWYPNILTRYSAIDGWAFTNNTFDAYGRPGWDKKVLEKLMNENIIHKNIFDYYNMLPTEYACTQSHINIWKMFLSGKDDRIMVLEDDTKPTSRVNKKYIEDCLPKLDCDILYLFSPIHPGKRIKLDKNNFVIKNRSHMGYVMTRIGAERAIEAMNPIIYQSDTQTPLRCAQSMINSNIKLPKLKNVERIKVKGMPDPLVEHNMLAVCSTFTKNGRKNWLPKDMRIE